jgi:hypothetical protein
MEIPLLITVAQAMQRWGVGKSKLYSYFGSGQIEARKLGTRTLVVVASGDEFFENLPRFCDQSSSRSK